MEEKSLEIEDEILGNLKPVKQRLLKYGFQEKDGQLVFTKKIINGDFSVKISIAPTGQVTGHIFDLAFGDEYTNFRAKYVAGEFAGKVRETYVALLKSIADQCFTFDNHAHVGQKWIVPANPKYFDVDQAFREKSTIIWKQTSNIKVNDLVYLYVTSPISAIRYKCLAVEVNIPQNYRDANIKMNKAMRIHFIRKYDKTQFALPVLKQYGVTTVRGPRHMPKQLTHYMQVQEGDGDE